VNDVDALPQDDEVAIDDQDSAIDAAPDEDTDAKLSEDDTPVVSKLLKRIEALESQFRDSKHVTNRATSSLDRLNNRLDDFATKEELLHASEAVESIRGLLDIGLADVMSEEGKTVLAQQRQDNEFQKALNTAKEEIRAEIAGAPDSSKTSQITDEQLSEGARRAGEASVAVYSYGEAKGLTQDEIGQMPIWNVDANQTLDAAVASAKAYIDKMTESTTEQRIAQRKNAAAPSPNRASASTNNLTREKLETMTAEEIRAIPREQRMKALQAS